MVRIRRQLCLRRTEPGAQPTSAAPRGKAARIRPPEALDNSRGCRKMRRENPCCSCTTERVHLSPIEKQLRYGEGPVLRLCHVAQARVCSSTRESNIPDGRGRYKTAHHWEECDSSERHRLAAAR